MPPRISPARWLFWLIPCLLYIYGAANSPHRNGRDLIPTPDAMEYALLAHRIADLESPLIPVGLHLYPSRYPLTVPILFAPFALLLPLNAMWIAAAAYGLLATLLLAIVGRWLLGSRLAGGLAASFWAMHPETLSAASHAMSETALVALWLVALLLARPLLSRSRPFGTLRAALLGLALGWLTVSKAPFVYWAAACALLALLHARRERRIAPAAALIGAGLACAICDLLYRHWAFGSWATNGYEYWLPRLYADFSVTFHPRYLTEAWGPYPRDGNLLYYGKMIAGLTHDFYSPYMAVTLCIAAVCLIWPRRRGRPRWLVVWLMAGWALTGALFCGLYFYQSTRFPHLWIPVADLLAAWGLAAVPLWRPLRRGPFRLHAWARLFTLCVAALLLRGEWRRVDAMYFKNPDRRRPANADIIPPLLHDLPAGAWLLTNYELPLLPFYRPTPGPNAALYVWHMDAPHMNGHVFAGDVPFPPRGRSAAAAFIDSIPPAWRTASTALISDGEWRLDPPEARELFGAELYVLLYEPSFFMLTHEHLRDAVWPMVGQYWDVEPVRRDGELSLHRLRPRTIPPSGALP